MSNTKPEKTMSSRLLTMKVCPSTQPIHVYSRVSKTQESNPTRQFMQRAAASAAASASTLPTTQPSPIPYSNDDSIDTRPSPKRQKLLNQNASSIQSTDLQAISAAIKAEEEKRTA